MTCGAPASVHPNFVTLHCVVGGSILYTARIDLGMQLWDLGADPAVPQLIGEVDTAGQVRGIAVGPKGIYLADEQDGLQVVPLHDALAAIPGEGAGSHLLSLAVTPNPTRGPVRLEFQAPSGGLRWAAIYDVTGRKIRLSRDAEASGSRQGLLLWDGRDEEDRPVAPGTYLLRMHATGSDVTRSIVVIR